MHVAHRLNPNGGMYGCHLDPAGWTLASSPSNLHPLVSPEVALPYSPTHVGQHWPSRTMGWAQVGAGHTMSSHTTLPLLGGKKVFNAVCVGFFKNNISYITMSSLT